MAGPSRAGLAIAAASVLAGCTAFSRLAVSPGSSAAASYDGTATLAVEVSLAKGFRSQSLVHRWVAADVYRYDFTLDDLTDSPPLKVATASMLAQGGPASISFHHLAAGHRYRASVVAMGNPGADGSSPLDVLNSQNPTAVDLDFTSNQNLQDQLFATASITLDSTLFAGSLSAQAVPPSGTATVSAELFDTAAPSTPLYSQTFAGAPQSVAFDNLKVGTRYQVVLTALKASGGGLEAATASSTPFEFDPALNDLPTAAIATMSAWSAWQAATP